MYSYTETRGHTRSRFGGSPTAASLSACVRTQWLARSVPAWSCMRESRDTVPLLLLLLASAFAVVWARSRHARTVRHRQPIHEDCSVSECGADGVPLSLYAG